MFTNECNPIKWEKNYEKTYQLGPVKTVFLLELPERTAGNKPKTNLVTNISIAHFQ